MDELMENQVKAENSVNVNERMEVDTESSELSELLVIRTPNVQTDASPHTDELDKPQEVEETIVSQQEPDKFQQTEVAVTEEKVAAECNGDTTENSFSDIELKLREIHDYQETIKDFCRLCARMITDDKLKIYSDNNEDIDSKISTSLPVKVAKEDGLPQQVCNSCWDRVIEWHEFSQLTLQAEKILHVKFPDNEKRDAPEQQPEVVQNEAESTVKCKNSNELLEENVKTKKDESDEDIPAEYLDDSQLSGQNFKCRLCYLYLDAGECIRHAIDVHKFSSEYVYPCIACEMGYSSPKIFEAHFREKHLIPKKRTHQCKVCLKKYATAIALSKHTCCKSVKNSELECEICEKTFPSKMRLNFHRQFHLEGARPFACSECKIKFDSENKYYDHVNFIHKTSYQCEECDKTFTMKSQLFNHKRIHSGVRMHKCTECGKSFLNKQTLREHSVCHMETKPFQCHVCGRSLNRASRLRQHLLTHQSEPITTDIQTCSICKEAFATYEDALKHQKSEHSGVECVQVVSVNKVYRCEYCERCFYLANALLNHRTGHTGDNPFSCHICKASFPTYSRCTTHKTTHGLFKAGVEKNNFPAVKHFLCDICCKSYLHWTYLGVHRRIKHSGKRYSYRCDECGEEFPNSWGIAYHRKSKIQCQKFKKAKLQAGDSKRKGLFKCWECNKVFINQLSLETHLHSHSGLSRFRCSFCPLIYPSVEALSPHLKQHSEKKHTCVTCNKIFSKKSDLEMHEREHFPKKCILRGPPLKQYSCDVCNESFTRAATLKQHKFENGHDRPFKCGTCLKHFRTKREVIIHKKQRHSGKFVLMVDMFEDQFDEQNEDSVKKVVEPTDCVQALIDDGSMPANDSLNDNFIEMSDGRLFKVQGNLSDLLQVGNKEFVIVNENGENNASVAMIVDDHALNLESVEMQQVDEGKENEIKLVEDGQVDEHIVVV